MRKPLRFLLFGSLAVFVVGELIGRYYGLTSYPLFIANPGFEYISAPNQDVYIYGRHFRTNQYSQRSEPLHESDTLVYLLIGDSVVYGGNAVDQDSLASTILERQLRRKTGRPIRVLNISSKEWGPDNAAAYIHQYGAFSADKIILVVSSHDAYDTMTFTPVVGIREGFPAQNTRLAWTKLIEKGWLIISARLREASGQVDTSGLAQSERFNSGFDSFRKLTDSLHIPLIMYLHKTTYEVQSGNLEVGGKEIRMYCRQYHIPFIEGNENEKLYDDYIHFNESGQRFLGDKLYPILLQ